MRRLNKQPIGCVGVFISLSTSLWANAGTPLMWASMLHLVFGNAIIGIAEGLVIALVFKRSKVKCIALMIGANYLSAWGGGVAISWAAGQFLSMTLENAWQWIWVMVGLTYLLTLVLEFPFVALAFRGHKAWGRKAVLATLVVQTLSYVVIFGWYWGASGKTLYTKATVADINDMTVPPLVQVYFISDADGHVYTGDLTDRVWTKVFDLNSTHPADRLYAQPSTENPGRFDLMAQLRTDDWNNPRLVMVKENAAAVIALYDDERTTDPAETGGPRRDFGEVPKLGDARTSQWEFWTGVWAVEGLRGRNSETNDYARISLETPFVRWYARNATHFPGDSVLVQLGSDQICLFDPDSYQVAFLVKGRGPVAVMTEIQSQPAEVEETP